MNATRWKQVNDLFHAALDLPPPQRDGYLARAAAGDDQLLSEVRSLLAAHDASPNAFLETPAWGVAPELMFDGEQPTLSGRTIGPYRVLDEIGRGGMGIVYAAEDTRLGREVALKALAPDYSNDKGRRERLRREARAAAALTHPAIATVFALEELDGELYIVSELVRGQTLREQLHSGPLDLATLRSTLLEIADALAAAHARGIVHRDLKPENVIRGVDGHVKILDFGLARAAGRDSDPTLTRLTQVGAAVGTPGYMAPEQLSGGLIDTRTDIYAFGVLAAELATGSHPGSGDGRTWPDPVLQSVAQRCLNSSPDLRYRSGAELAAALREITAAERGEGAGDARWWWRFHQMAAAIVLASMPAMAFFIRKWIGPDYGSWLFFASLTLATISVTLRLNLVFTSRVHPAMLRQHRARVFPAVPILDIALAVMMLAAALRLGSDHDAMAGLLIGVAVVTIASAALIEPATTRAAGID